MTMIFVSDQTVMPTTVPRFNLKIQNQLKMQSYSTLSLANSCNVLFISLFTVFELSGIIVDKFYQVSCTSKHL